jgi:hypothetical protein
MYHPMQNSIRIGYIVKQLGAGLLLDLATG